MTESFDSTNATFTYPGVTVGQALIPKGKAGLFSTKKISVSVATNSNALSSTNSSLASDLSAKLSGKVGLMYVIKQETCRNEPHHGYQFVNKEASSIELQVNMISCFSSILCLSFFFFISIRSQGPFVCLQNKLPGPFVCL